MNPLESPIFDDESSASERINQVLNTEKNDSDFSFFETTRFAQPLFLAKQDALLKGVSRTFHPVISMLPRKLRIPVTNSYLLCRLLDTIEDTPDIEFRHKQDILQRIQEVLHKDGESEHLQSLFDYIAETYDICDEEKEVLLNANDIFESIKVLPPTIRNPIYECAHTMASGMQQYAFGKDKPEVQLQTKSDLENYTYYVAGTVGEMLNQFFVQDEYGLSSKSKEIMHNFAIDFGKALQYVNIIKDSRFDIQEGRCFIPKTFLDAEGLTLESFFDGENQESVLRVYNRLIERAYQYLENAVSYIDTIEITERTKPIRRFCIGPVLSAYKTLSSFEAQLPTLLQKGERFKIPRVEMMKLLVQVPLAAGNQNQFHSFLKPYQKTQA